MNLMPSAPGLVLAAVAGFVTPRAAAAQEPAPPAFPLGEIVVSAEDPVSEATATTRRVTAEDIEAYGARTLDEAIGLLPGVYVRSGADGVPRVDLHGFRTRQVTLLLDGVPLNATSDGQFDPSFVPVEQIAEIKLTSGTSSVLYGSGGLAGTINIVTRRGAGRPSATARGEWRDGDAWLGRVTGAGSTGPLDAFLSASGTSVGGVPSVGGSPTLGSADSRRRLNSDRRRLNISGQVGLMLGASGTAGLTVQSVNGDYGTPPSVIDDPADPFASRPVYERVEDLDGLTAQLAGTFAVAPQWSVRGWAYRNQLEQLTDRYADSTFDPATVLAEPGTSRDRSRSARSGLALQVGTTAAPLGRITLGLTAGRSAWEQDLVEALAPQGGAGGAGGGTAAQLEQQAANRALWEYGVALEYEVRPAANLGLVAGGMYHRLDGEGLEQGGAGASLGAYVDPTRALRLRAAYAHRFRFPTLRQLFDVSAGNPTLDTEQADVYELGVAYTGASSAMVGVGAYRADARNFIERPQGAVRFENAERYRLQGLEVEVAFRPTARLLARARYTYLDAEDRTAGREGTRLQYRPRHLVAGELRYTVRWGLLASTTLHYVAEQVYETRRLPLVQADLSDYALVGARLEQRLGTAPVAIYAGVDNLLGTAYEESYGFPQAQRVVYLGLDLHR